MFMKRKSFLMLFAVLAVVTGLVSFKKLTKKKHADPSPLVFWTSNPNYGPIEVFVDNVYQGDITSAYSRIPDCASNGCVTVMITGTEWFKAQTKDGRHKWQSWQHTTLVADACNSEQLR
jgi:hypothetical protein